MQVQNKLSTTETSNASSPRLPEPKDAKLVESALPFVFRADYAKADFETALRDYWQLLLPRLPELLEARTKTKPPEVITEEYVYSVMDKWTFYSPLLLDLVARDVSQAAWPKEPLHMQDLGVLETENGYMVSCQVFLMPEASFQDFDGKVRISLPLVDVNFEAEAERAVQGLRQGLTAWKEKAGGVACDGDSVWCSITAIIDGQLWPAGTLKQSQLLVEKDALKPSSLYDFLLGKGVGNYKTEFLLDDRFGSYSGKQVQADVSIHTVFEPNLLTLDELAKTKGFSDAEALLSAEIEKAKKRFSAKRAEEKERKALEVLTKKVELGPVPASWLREEAQEQWSTLLARAKSDRAVVLAHLGVANEQEAMICLGNAIKARLHRSVALLCYGDFVQLKRERHESIAGLPDYLQRALDHLIEHNLVVEPAA